MLMNNESTNRHGSLTYLKTLSVLSSDCLIFALEGIRTLEKFVQVNVCY